MRITDEMVTSAVNRATNLGLLPQTFGVDLAQDCMREVLKAAWAVAEPDHSGELAGMMRMKAVVDRVMGEAIKT